MKDLFKRKPGQLPVFYWLLMPFKILLLPGMGLIMLFLGPFVFAAWLEEKHQIRCKIFGHKSWYSDPYCRRCWLDERHWKLNK